MVGFFAASVFAEHHHRQELEDVKEYFKEKYDEEVRSHLETINSYNPDSLKSDKPDEVTIEGVTYDIEEQVSPEEVEETTVEAAKSLIEHEGYTSYNTVMPEKPKGPTVTSLIQELPVTISFDEYDNTPPGYEQYTLTYYEGSNTLVSQAGKVIKGKDLVRTIGDLLGTFKEGEDAIWVRNPKLKMDFEIVRDAHSFTDVDG